MGLSTGDSELITEGVGNGVGIMGSSVGIEAGGAMTSGETVAMIVGTIVVGAAVLGDAEVIGDVVLSMAGGTTFTDGTAVSLALGDNEGDFVESGLWPFSQVPSSCRLKMPQPILIFLS
jgi:hypothetical protein